MRSMIEEKFCFCAHHKVAKVVSFPPPSQVWRRAAGGVVGPAAAPGVELGHVERGGLHQLVLVLGAQDEAAHRHDDGDQREDYDAARDGTTCYAIP